MRWNDPHSDAARGIRRMRLGIENLESRQLLSGTGSDPSATGTGTDPAAYSGPSGGGSTSGGGSGSATADSFMNALAGVFAAGDLGYYRPPEVFYPRDVTRDSGAYLYWQPSSQDNNQYSSTRIDVLGGTQTDSHGSTWTVSGNPYSYNYGYGGSTDASWSEVSTTDVATTYHRADTGASGLATTLDFAGTLHVAWQASSSDGQTINYKVTVDVSATSTTALNDPATPANRGNQGSSFDYHLVSTAQVVGGTVVSSSNTFKGEGEEHYKIHQESGTDGQGNPSDATGMVLDVALASTFTIDDQSGVGPAATNSSQDTATKSAHDNFTTWDGGVGNLIATTANEDDFNEDDYNHAPSSSAAPPPSTPVDPSAPTTSATGPVSGGGNVIPFPLTLSGHVIYIIDTDDKGWEDFGYTPAGIIIAHPFVHDPLPATGQDFYNTLKPTVGFIKMSNVPQIVADAGTRSAKQKADFIIIADHGSAATGQSVGLPGTSPTDTNAYINKYTSAATIGSLLGDLAPGGWLVLAGCSAGADLDFKQKLWAEVQNFPRIGGVYVSNSVTGWTRGGGMPSGDWQPITPGQPQPRQ